MLIETRYFGEIEINEDTIIHFPKGIPGFVDEKQFVLLDVEDNPVFQVLQSTNNVDPAFIVTNPFRTVRDYQFDLDENTLELLEIEAEEEVGVLSIVSLKDPLNDSTINLQAPIVLNTKKLLGKQYITNLKSFSTKASLFPHSIEEKVK
ncbi:flagellar assembly protein FliW [Aquibacillus salsiterrae]|uniref:Flagellar assembly factor FliW n=1 Tax=Aquibacillus salsiterrae TaxID=2950439 RepID=A0A9X3WEW2_9BACI|nr:flagellar assembly protein FliW [Aquibacillus salsiterrae]MDC3416129.1 flagellar assembly protein FliW [Aquibacillus salsiterrae]